MPTFQEMMAAARVPGPSFIIEEWAPGVNTILTHVGDRARGQISGGANPRISKRITGLVAGVTYRWTYNIYEGTETGNIITRASATQNLTVGDYGQLISSFGEFVTLDFVAPVGGIAYLGWVSVTSADLQYTECDWVPNLVRL